MNPSNFPCGLNRCIHVIVKLSLMRQKKNIAGFEPGQCSER